MSAVVEWTLDRPPNLDKDFPDDRANGERARDVWYERRAQKAIARLLLEYSRSNY